MVPESFSPISLLPILAKVTEKVVQNKLVCHMSIKGIWNINLHSYRKLYSITTALTEVCNQIFSAADERDITATITIDESSTFDPIAHDILLRKFKTLETTLAWMEDYLKYRTQYVSLGGQLSTMRSIGKGVPQCSILITILFNIFINDLPDINNDYHSCNDSGYLNSDRLFANNCKKCGTIMSFADDAIYLTSNRTRQSNQNRLEEMMHRLKTYLNNNRMMMNTSKARLWEFMLNQKLCKTRG